MASFIKSLSRFKWFPRTHPCALQFPTTGFQVVRDSVLLEEEQFEDEFSSGKYYPVNIGDFFASKYQVVGKLGFGTTSTVWLARDLVGYGHKSLKIYTQHWQNRKEFQTLKMIREANPSHPGHGLVRTALDLIELSRPSGNHFCLVQKPMWESLSAMLGRNPIGRFPDAILRGILRNLFMALDYLHTECKLIHTDIKADNILMDIMDYVMCQEFEEAEINSPSPRKQSHGMTVYSSRLFDRPRRWGGPGHVLGDLGAAVRGDLERNHNAQPAIYRSPEVMLKIPWSYPVDIWNVGVMIWDIFEGRQLFYGYDPNRKNYSTRAHLAELIALLGPPPKELLERGERSPEFFCEDGKWIADLPISPKVSLESEEAVLEGENKVAFLNMVRGMLQWRPEDRKSARELFEDPWLMGE